MTMDLTMDLTMKFFILSHHMKLIFSRTHFRNCWSSEERAEGLTQVKFVNSNLQLCITVYIFFSFLITAPVWFVRNNIKSSMNNHVMLSLPHFNMTNYRDIQSFNSYLRENITWWEQMLKAVLFCILVPKVWCHWSLFYKVLKRV